ncbi:hypothetical protein Ancab_034882 [Ancistrocladus abbreviatus]
MLIDMENTEFIAQVVPIMVDSKVFNIWVIEELIGGSIFNHVKVVNSGNSASNSGGSSSGTKKHGIEGSGMSVTPVMNSEEPAQFNKEVRRVASTVQIGFLSPWILTVQTLEKERRSVWGWQILLMQIAAFMLVIQLVGTSTQTRVLVKRGRLQSTEDAPCSGGPYFSSEKNLQDKASSVKKRGSGKQKKSKKKKKCFQREGSEGTQQHGQVASPVASSKDDPPPVVSKKDGITVLGH